MSDKPAKTKKKMPPGKPFTKGDPRAKQGGRPRKTVEWKAAEDALRRALPMMLMASEEERQEILSDNPTGAEQLAARFLEESPNKALERFLGKMPEVLTGANGAPLIPAAPPVSLLPPMDFKGWSKEQVDAFIAGTSAAAARLAQQVPGTSAALQTSAPPAPAAPVPPAKA